MIWTKGTHQSAKFQTFDYSRGISSHLYFDRLLLLKLYKISAKKSIEELCLIALNSDAKFKEKLICCFKNDNVLTEKSTEELSFMTLKSDPKIEQNYFVVLKTTWEILQIFTRPLKSLKIGIFMGSFNPK